MISLTLFALAVSWLVLLRRHPRLFARPRKRSAFAGYHYYVGSQEPLPTWKRK